MKKYLFLFTYIFAGTITVHGQEIITIPDTLQGSEISWVSGLNGSQASYSNWAQGGVNNIAGTGFSIFTVKYKKERFGYGFLINTRYGRTKIEDDGTRKIDDLLSLRNRFLYDLDEDVWKLFGNLNFRTQFDKGYDYGKGPEGGDLLISKFMAPGYLVHNIGVAYLPSENFFTEIGIGGEHTFIGDTDLSETYGLDAGDSYRFEAGLTFAAGYEQVIATNLSYTSALETFWAFNKPAGSTDIHFSNQVSGRINSFMNASLKLDLVYDDDFSKEIQLAQILSLGISFNLI